MIKNKKHIIIFLVIALILMFVPTVFASNSDNFTTIDDSSLLKENSHVTTDEKLNNNNQDSLNLENDDTIYVSKEGNDEFNGTSENPVLTIGKAIELASSTNNTAQKIIINEGKYLENDLNIVSELEIISNGNVIIDGKNKDIILTIDTEKEVKIEGITFQNGRGGAIYVNDAKLTINNCIFFNNTSDYGGALYWNANNGVLSNSYFTQNHARIGSAIIWGAREESGYEIKGNNGLIVNVTLEDNDNHNTGAGCMGLAIYGSNVKVANSSFINNNAPHISTGGCLHILGEDVVVDNCLFENNSMDQAPAIQCDGDFATISNNRFINNTISSTESATGGAINILSSNAQVINNIFMGNGGENCYNGGAISIIYEGYKGDEIINISNNKFIDNSAVYGGSIFIEGGYETYCIFKEMIVANNIFDSNIASTTAGVYVRNVDLEQSIVILENNTFKNLVSEYVSSIFIDYAGVKLSNNTIFNCTSLDGNNHIYNLEGFISGNLTVTVNNNNTVELLAGKTIDVNATVVDDMNNSISGGNIRFIVMGSDVDEDGFSLESGVATVNFKSSVVGMFLVSADYVNGDLATVKTSIVIALPYDILIYFENQTGLSSQNITVPIFVIVNDDLLDSENITVTFNNETYNVMVTNGTAYITLKLPEENGTYNLTVEYDIQSATQPIVVKDNSVKLDVPDVTVTPNTGKLNITLKDSENNPLAGHEINVKFANISKTLTTDEKGYASVDLNLSTGKYDVKVEYVNDKYKSANMTSTITVDYLKVILSSSNITMDYHDGTPFIVRLTDSNSNPLANQTVNITLDKNYSLVTDSNGIVSMLLTQNPGKYSALVKYGGNNIYTASTNENTILINSKAKLTANGITMYYSDSKTYKVRIYGYDGKIVGAGVKVKIIVNKKTYTRYTNSNGYASLKITLTPGTYTIKSSCNNVVKSNKIIVKKILSAKNISKKKSKTIKFSAKLAKGKKLLSGKTIKFKIKGKTYKVKTNKKGIATVSLKNLKVGKYTIKTTYSKSTIKNTITIKK